MPAGEDGRLPSAPSSPVSPTARAGKPRSRRAAAEEAAAPRPPATEGELAVAALFAGPLCTFSAQESAAARAQVRPRCNHSARCLVPSHVAMITPFLPLNLEIDPRHGLAASHPNLS